MMLRGKIRILKETHESPDLKKETGFQVDSSTSTLFISQVPWMVALYTSK